MRCGRRSPSWPTPGPATWWPSSTTSATATAPGTCWPPSPPGPDRRAPDRRAEKPPTTQEDRMSPENRPADFGFTAGDLMVVTGAGSGIGRATARLGAAAGLAVAAWDLDAGTAEGIADDILAAGGAASWARVDVTNADEVAGGFAGLGRPARYLVNNAGPASAVPVPFADGLVMGAGSMELVARTWMS